MKKRLIIAAALSVLLLTGVAQGARADTGLYPAGHSYSEPGYYIRAEDPILGPCHVTDDYESSAWTGSLGPGQSFSTTEWFCGPDDATVLPGYLNEGSDEDMMFLLSAKSGLSVSLTLETPDRGVESLPVVATSGKGSFDAKGCSFAGYRERYDGNNVTYYQRGYVTVTVTNTSARTVRGISLSTTLDLAGSPRVAPYC